MSKAPPCPQNLPALVQTFPSYVRNANTITRGNIVDGSSQVSYHKGYDTITHQEVLVKEFVNADMSPEETMRFIREIYILASTKSSGIIKLIGFTVTYPMSIITEAHHGPSLYQAIHSGMSPTNQAICALALAYTLWKLHQRNIIVRDIRTKSIYLNHSNYPVITDLSNARPIGLDMSSNIGTPRYMAPELITTNNYNEKVDVYAFGCILYEMCEGKPPFSGLNHDEVLTKVVAKGERAHFSKTSSEMKSFIKLLWSEKPYKRPSMNEIYQKFLNCKIIFPREDKDKVRKLGDKYLEKETVIELRPKPSLPVTVDINSLLQILYSNPSHVIPSDMSKSKSRNSLDTFNLPSQTNLQSQHVIPSSEFCTLRPGTNLYSLPPSAFATNFDDQIIDIAPPTNHRHHHHHHHHHHHKEIKEAPLPVIPAMGIRPSIPGGNSLPGLPTIKISFKKLKTPEPESEWKEELVQTIGIIQPPDYNHFYHALENILIKGGQNAATVLMAFSRLLKRNPAFIDILEGNNFWIKVPTANSSRLLVYPLFEIFHTYILKKPNILGEKCEGCLRILLMNDPTSLFMLISQLIKRVGINAINLFQTIMPYEIELLTNKVYTGAKEFLIIVDYFLQNYPKFATLHEWSLLRLNIEDLINCTDENVALTAINLMTRNWNNQFNVNIDNLIIKAEYPIFYKSILSLLLRMNYLLPSISICTLLLRSATITREGHFALLKFIFISPEHAQLLLQTLPQWCDLKLPTSQDTLRILIALYTYHDIRLQLSQAPDFPKVLNLCLEAPTQFTPVGLSSIIIQSILTPEFVSNLCQLGFVKKFLAMANTCLKEEIVTGSLYMVDALAKVFDSSDFSMIIPMCMQILRSLPALTSNVINLFTQLSSMPLNKQNLANNIEIVNYFKTLLQYPDFHDNAVKFFDNIGDSSVTSISQ